MATMISVSITELKANLSRYIREVRKGAEIQVLHRGKPVARITSPMSGSDTPRDALIRAGVLTPGNGRAGEILSKPLIKLHASLSAAVIEDRDDRV